MPQPFKDRRGKILNGLLATKSGGFLQFVVLVVETGIGPAIARQRYRRDVAQIVALKRRDGYRTRIGRHIR